MEILNPLANWEPVPCRRCGARLDARELDRGNRVEEDGTHHAISRCDWARERNAAGLHASGPCPLCAGATVALLDMRTVRDPAEISVTESLDPTRIAAPTRYALGHFIRAAHEDLDPTMGMWHRWEADSDGIVIQRPEVAR